MQRRDSLESASLLSSSSRQSSQSPSSPPITSIPDSGVPLQYIQLDERFKVARMTAIPAGLMALAFLLSDLVVLKQAEDPKLLSSVTCPHLLTSIRYHAYLMFIMLFIISLMLLRPIAHKGLPFLFGLFGVIVIVDIPFGSSLVFPYGKCRHDEWSVPYWHSAILSWLHFWPIVGLAMLFLVPIRSWFKRGWAEGRMRGFLSKETERAPFVGTTQVR